jgi:pimeloyl-ACP methyl ester carboxylesterase
VVLTLSCLESFYVGGEYRQISSPYVGREETIVGAMYVQHISPAEITFNYPVVFIHGGIHTGVTWETTPDGREGWQTLFVRAGFDTYTIDQPWRGRSAPDLRGIMPGQERAVEQSPVMIGGARLVERFHRGGNRFPAAHSEDYLRQLWPDFAIPKTYGRDRRGYSDPGAVAPIAELINRIGDVVLVTHSQGGHLGWEVAKAQPSRVKGIYAVEPALTSPGLDDAEMPRVPVCLLWGDNLPAEGQSLTRRDLAQRSPSTISRKAG